MNSDAAGQQPVVRSPGAEPVSSNGTPVVGIGASAGGLRVLQQFFQHMPGDSNMAFVVILHLSPDHESNLAALLQHHTAMPVTQVNEPTPVRPNHVYVIPPAKHLSMTDGTLRLSESYRPRGGHVAIDLFFRTLAEARGSRAAAIVLSGTGSDGTSGMKRVKELGGVTFAQDPADAEFDTMPRSAIETGLVDYVLPVEQMPAQLLEYVRNAEKIRLPVEVQRDDGLCFMARLLPYRTSDDRIDGVVLTFVDITERKRAEEARLESRRQTELILESITDAYISIDSGWRGVYMNQAAERLLGMRRAQMIGNDIRQIYAGTDIAKFFDRFQSVIDQRVTIELDAYYEIAQIWVEMRIFPTSDGGIAIYQRDISDRKQAEESLRASQEWLRLLNENILDYAITLLDAEGRFVDWNAGAERMFGYTAAEMLGQPSGMIFTPEDRAAGVPEIEMQTARDEGHSEDERWHLRKDGSRFWVSGVMTAMRDEGGRLRGFAKIARDLTERMRSDEALRRAHDDLEQWVSERTIDLAAANTSLQREIAERGRAQAARDEVARQLIIAEEHERKRISRELHDQMGQQLTALMLGLRALKDAPGRSAEQGQAIDQLQNIADQIGREVHQLALDLRPTALDDLGLAAALANYAEEWERRSQIEVSFHSHGLDDQRPSSEVETAIYRVVLEALNNVARHAQATHVSLIIERQDHQLAAIVEDDGHGFDAEAVLSTLRSQQRLGLLGMRERMTQIGGSLTVEATPGNGTTIIARVSLRREQEEPADG